MPRQRRGGSRLLLSFWLIALMSSVAVLGGMSHPTAALAETGEESPQPSETSSEEPTEEPPQIQCPGVGGAGPLPEGPSFITGTVTNGSGALADIEVSLRSMSSGGLQTTFSGPLGEFGFENLGDDTYWLGFHDYNATYQSGFYDGAGPLALTPEDSTGIVVSGGNVTGIQAVLGPESFHAMSGTVTTFQGSPVNFAEVYANGAYFPLVGCALSNSSGAYAISGLRTGVYTVEAQKSGQPTTERPGAVTVAGDVTGIDIQFPEVFSLDGVVRDAGGTLVDAVGVIACGLGPDFFCRTTSSDENGAFQVTGLPAGEYRLQLTDFAFPTRFKNGYYGGEDVFVTAEADAAILTIPAGPVSVRVEAAPVVAGTLRNTNDEPIPDALVNVCDIDDVCYGDYTDAAGEFGIGVPDVREASLRVNEFSGTYPQDSFMRPGGLLGRGRGDAEVFTAGVTDITGLELRLPFGGRISGNVTIGGEPAQFVTVGTCGEDQSCNQVSTDEFGDFVSLPEFEGSYFVYSSPEGEFLYWYVDGGPPTQNLEDSSAIQITEGGVETIQLHLPAAGTITPQGEDVQVTVDDGTGTNPVSLTFDEVTFPGVSTLTSSDSGDPVPNGFQLGLPAVYYDIATTASFAGSIRVCVSYANVTFLDPAGVHLFHYDASIPGWEDITDPPVDTANQVVCGITDSLSPFVLAERDYVFGGFMGPKAPPIINDVKAGNTVGISFSLGGDVGLAIFAAGSPQVRQLDCTTGVLDLLAQDAVGSLKYNRNSGLYTYNWVTQKAWKNTCRQVTLTFPDGDSAVVWYRLKP